MIQYVNIGPLQRKILRILGKGGRLYSDRQFPAERQYWLAEEVAEIPTRITEAAVADMIERGFLRAPSQLGDTVVYELTEKGREVMQSGRIEYDDAQPTLF